MGRSRAGGKGNQRAWGPDKKRQPSGAALIAAVDVGLPQRSRSEDERVPFEAQTDQPYLNLSLRNIPTGTFDGTLTGVYHVTGDIEPDNDFTADVDFAAGGPGSRTASGTGVASRAVMRARKLICDRLAVSRRFCL